MGKIRPILLACLVLACQVVQPVRAETVFRLVMPSPTAAGSGSAPAMSKDDVTGLTVTVPCTSCVIRITKPYTFQLAANDSPHGDWSVFSGGLPPGLSINPKTGLVSGSPTAIGSYTTIFGLAQPPAAPVRSPTVTISVNPLPYVDYASTSGTYGRTLDAAPTTAYLTGDPTFAVVAGILPAGVSLDAATGRLTGNVRSNAYGVKISITDPDGTVGTSKPFDVLITNAPSLSYPGADYSTRVGVAFTVTPTVANMAPPYTVSVLSGTLPPGLGVAPSTGTISGSPSFSGTWDGVVMQVTDPSGASVDSRTLKFIVGQPKVTYAGGTTWVGQTFSQYPVTEFLNKPNYSASSGSVPSGIGLTSSTGQFYGVAKQAGSSTLAVLAVDPQLAQATSPDFVIQVLPALTAAMGNVTGRVGIPLTATASSSNFTTTPTWSLFGTLPAGLAFDTAKGVISGTPSKSGTASGMQVTASQAGGSVNSPSFSVTVLDAFALSYPTPVSLLKTRPAKVAATVVGAMSPPSFVIASGTLPAGLSVNPSTGAIEGTPTAAGTQYGVKVLATDTGGSTTSNPVDLVVSEATATMASATTRVGRFFTQTAGSTLVTSPSWAKSTGSSPFPSGLVVQPSGVVEGTPRTAGTYDGLAMTATGTDVSATTPPFRITVLAPLQVTLDPADASQAAHVGVATTAHAPTVSNNTGPVTFGLANVGGTQPAGSGVSSAGVVTYTGTAAGTWSYAVTATDPDGSTAQSQTATVTFSTALLASAQDIYVRAGKTGQTALVATNGTSVSWSWPTAPPADWLALSGSTVTAAPAADVAAATYGPYQAKATDSDGTTANAAFRAFVYAPLSLAAPGTVSGQAGKALSASAPAVTGQAGTLSYALLQGTTDVSGSLGATCPGLTFSTASSAISGTPSKDCSATLAYRVTDDGGTHANLPATATSSTFTLTVTPAIATASVGDISVVEGSPVSFSASSTLTSPTWTASGNPAWMTFAVTGGTYATNSVSADVSARQDYVVVLTARDAGGATSATSVNVTVTPASASVDPLTARSGAAFGTPVAETMLAAGAWAATASPADVTALTVTGGKLYGTAPANAGTAPVTRSLSATFTATAPPSAGAAAVATGTGTLTVYPGLAIASLPNQSGTTGSPLSFGPPTVTGAVGTLTYALYSGATDVSATLGATCPGLSFSKSTGVASGTPTATCGPSLTYRVADNGGGDANLAASATSASPFTLTVGTATVTASASALTIVEGDTASFSATTSLANPTWSAAGNPAWMTFTASGGSYATASVSGDVATSTTYPVVLTATSGSVTAQRTVTVTVTPASASLATPVPVRSGGTFSAAVSTTMAAPGTWTASANPADVTLLAVSGSTLSGKAPANAGTSASTRSLTATYTGPAVTAGARATASGTATLTVHPGLAVAAPANQSGQAGVALPFAAPAVTGAAGTLTYAMLQGGTDVSTTFGGVCPGLAFSTATGAVSGTPSAACSATLAYRVSDDGQPSPATLAATATSASFTLTVAPASGGASNSTVSVVEGSATTFSATTSLPNPTWSVTGNPAWMTFAASAGTYGTSSTSADVATSQTYLVSITATNASGATSASTVTVTVSPATASVGSASARSGAAFSAPLAQTMAAPGSWTVSASPSDVAGLTVSGSNLTGTAPSNPTAGPVTRTLTGIYTATTAPSSGAAATVSASGTLTVHPALAIATLANQTGSVGSAVTFGPPTASGVVGTLTYTLLTGATDVSATLGATCPGLSFSKTTGTVSGTPTGTCAPSLTYQVSDNGGGNAALVATATSPAPFTLTVGSATVSASTNALTVMEGDNAPFSATTSLPSPTWSVSGNPAWMAFTASGGTYATASVSGDVTVATTYPVVLKATSGSATAQQTVNVTVNPAVATLATPAPVRTGGTFSAAVSKTMAAPGAWTAAASPADVTSLAVATNTLTGKAPANAGTGALTRALTVTYMGPAVTSGSPAAATASATLTVHPALSVAAPANQSGQAGAAMSFAVPATVGQTGTVTWALMQGTTDVSGSLATVCPGLAFAASTGAVSGTPSGTCTATLAYKATDDGGSFPATLGASATSTTFTLSVTPAMATASTPSVSAVEGSRTSFSATTSLPSPTWSASGNPAWMTFAASGGTYATNSVSADIAFDTSYAVTLKATNASGATSTTVVNATVTASTATVGNAATRSGGTFAMALSNTMVAPGSWTATASPADVTSLAVSGSTLTGRAPANAGASALTRAVVATLTATGAPSSGAAAASAGTGTLTVHPPLTIATQAAKSGTVGSALSFGPPAVGGQVGSLTYTLLSGATDVSAILGSTCPGLSFAKATGTVSGTPTAACGPSLSYRVADNGGGDATLAATADSPAAFTLSVIDASVTASKSSLTVTEGDTAPFSATTTLPTPTWSASGNPGWMTFTATGGTYATASVSGDVSASTTYPVVVKATSGTATAQQTVNVTVAPAAATLATPAPVRSGGTFSAAVASTMAAPGTWSAASSPADATGMGIANATLSGRAPTNTGTAAFTRGLTATYTGPAVSSGSAAVASGSSTLTVYPGLAVAAPANQSGQAGIAMSFAAPSVTGKVGGLTYAMLQGGTDVSATFGSVCPGLAFSTATGAVTGAPGGTCSATLAYRVADDGGAYPATLGMTVASSTFTLVVSPAMSTASTSSVTVTEGDAASFSATTSLSSPTWSASGNPAWMTFTATGGTYATASVSADVASTATYPVVLTATNGSGVTTTASVSVTVNPASAALAAASTRSSGPFAMALSDTMAAAATWTAAANPADVTALAVSGSTLTGTAPANATAATVTRTVTATHRANAAPSAGTAATSAASATLSVYPALSIASQTAKSGTAGTAMSFAAPAVGGQVGTLTYTLFSGATDVSSTLGGTCPGLAFAKPTGLVSGTPTAACSTSLTYRVADDGAGNANLAATANTPAAFALNVVAATVTASSASLTLVEGETASLSATTTLANPTWSVSGQPAWMTFTASGGSYATNSVSADLASQATYSVVLTATNGSLSASKTVAVTVNPSSATLANPAPVRALGAFSAAMSTDMTVAGTWTVASTAGETFQPGSAAAKSTTFGGTAPANAGTAALVRTIRGTYTAAASPASGAAAAATNTASLTVYPALSVAAPANQTGGTGSAVAFAAPAVNGQAGTLAYALMNGSTDISASLSSTCPGLTFTTATGAVSGTATGGCAPTLSYKVTDNGSPNPATLAATVTSSPFTLTVTPATATASTSSVTVTEGNTASFSATTSLVNPTWSASGNPAWMTFTANGGSYATASVSGDVAASTTYPVVLTATSGGASAPTTVNVTVNPASATLGTPGPVRSGRTFTAPVSTTMAAAGSWTGTASPADVTGIVTSATAMTGTAPANSTAAPITRVLTATVTGPAVTAGTRATASGSATLTVNPALTMAIQASKTGKVGVGLSFGPPSVSYAAGNLTYVLTYGGVDYSDRLGSLCSGLTFTRSNGMITGTPSAACSPALNYTVSDDGGANPTLAATASPAGSFTLSVTAVIVTANATYTSNEGVAVSIQPSQVNATAPVTWTISSGTLPQGLSISATGGAITGTPAGRGRQNPITIRATGSDGAYGDSQAVTINITPAMVPRTVSGYQVGRAINSTNTYLVDSPYSYSNDPRTRWHFHLDPTGSQLPLGVFMGADQGLNGNYPDIYYNRQTYPTISGTPLESGTYTVRVVAKNLDTKQEITSDNVTFTVAPAPGAALPIREAVRNDDVVVVGWRTNWQRGVRLDPSDPLATTVPAGGCGASTCTNGKRNLRIVVPYRANAYGTAAPRPYDNWYAGSGSGGIYTGDFGIVLQASQTAIVGQYQPVIYFVDDATGGTGRVGVWRPTVKIFNSTTPKRAPVAFYTRTLGAASGSSTINTTLNAGDVIDIVESGTVPVVAENLIPFCGTPNTNFGPATYKVEALLPDGTWRYFFTRNSSRCDGAGEDAGVISGSVILSNFPGDTVVSSRFRMTMLSGSMPFKGAYTPKIVTWYPSDTGQGE